MSVNLNLRNTTPTVMFNMEKPTICALNGSAAGYGLDTALGCDIRIMAKNAKLAAAFPNRGIFHATAGTWFFPRLHGCPQAAESVLTGRTPLADADPVPSSVN